MVLMKACTFEGCGRPNYARTLCHTHYWQMRRGEELRPIKTRRSSDEARRRDSLGRKWCIRCSLWHPEADFVSDPGASDGLSSYCKPCRSAHARAWRYGITPEDLERMIHNQGGKCALCPASLAEGFCVDHDHACCPNGKTCGKCIRGLLCQECNKLVGKLEGDRERLARMLTYMKEGLS